MRNKAPLTMMEQVIMLLVFALAAALCLQAFAAADSQSKALSARDRAAMEAQTAAELLKHTGGDYAQAAELLGGDTKNGSLVLSFNESWNPADAPEIVYQLTALPADHSQPLLAQTTITVTAKGEPLFSLPVSWQTGGGQ